MNSSFKIRAVVEVVFGLAGALILIVGARHSGFALLIGDAVFLSVVAIFAGYAEPSAKLVCVHPLLILSPEIVFPPVAYVRCKGFECGSYMGIFMLAAGATLVLMVLSLSAFLVRRLLTANTPAQP